MRDEIRKLFPELEEIGNPELREKVVRESEIDRARVVESLLLLFVE